MDEVIQLLRQLFIVTTKNHSVPIEAFNSKRITNKLVQQIQDSLVLASNGLPDWCHDLTSTCPMVFPFETRLLYFQCTAFGASRSIGNSFIHIFSKHFPLKINLQKRKIFPPPFLPKYIIYIPFSFQSGCKIKEIKIWKELVVL